jgi:hypothetical protein
LQIDYRYGFPFPAPVRPDQSAQLVNVQVRDSTIGSLWRAAQPTPGAPCDASIAVASLAQLPPIVDDAIHVVDRVGRSATAALSVRHSGAVAVKFLFQHVAPGAYIRRTDAVYEQRWTAVVGNDDGRNGDRVASDGIYSALCPVEMLVPRSIVRWRVQVDYTGGQLMLPANADVPNFVFYYYYASVPPYRAAVDPSGSGAQATVDTFALADAEPMAVMHVIADEQDVWNGQFMYKANITTAPDDSGFPLLATVVVDDEVYDHVRWRCRGAAGRFAYGKNAWKFQLNDGHFMRLRQDGARGGAVPGRRLETLNVDSLFLNLMSGWQREYEPIGTHGMPQMMSARLFELNQLPSLWQSLVQFRVVIYANESATDQYATDFWGLYLAYEEPDGRYLSRHELPEGSLYKVERPPEPTVLKVQGLGQPNNTDDVLNMLAMLEVQQTESWHFDNVDMPLYYRFRAVATAIGHLDIGRGKNILFFRPSAGDDRVRVLPWDFDRTYVNSPVQDDRFNQTLLTPRGLREFHAHLSSFFHLYCNNSDEPQRLLDEQARRIFDASRSAHIAEAERRRWDFSPDLERLPFQAHPFQAGPGGVRRPAPKGMFYVRANTVPGVLGQQLAADIDTLFNIKRGDTTLFSGTFQTMLSNYLRRIVSHHCNILQNAMQSIRVATPIGPTAAPTAVNGLNVDDLRFSTSVPATANVTLEWQLAARHGANVGATPYRTGDAFRYELTPLHTASVPSTQQPQVFAVPIDMSLLGRLLRVRVRALASNGTASAWSPPLEFAAQAPRDATPPLVFSELMYHALESSAHDYVEVFNAAATERRLAGVHIDGGIRFRFAANDTAAGRAALVIARDPVAFAAHYGVAPFNAGRAGYDGSLSNSGETLEIKDVGGGVMDRLSYDSRVPAASALADGLGFALERTNAGAAASGAAAEWRVSVFKGTPGVHADGAAAMASPLLVNEVMAAPLDGTSDWVELFNSGSRDIDLGSEGWFLTDDVTKQPKRTPLTGSIAALGFKVVSRRELGFGFGTNGDQCYVLRVGGDGRPLGAIHGFEFRASPRGHSVGRYVTGDNREHLGVVLSVPTPGFENAYPAAPPLAVMALAIDLTEQRADNRARMKSDILDARPTRSAYVELAASGAPLDALTPVVGGDVLLSGATPTGSERWCVRGCRYQFCFDGERRGKRVVVSEARTLWFTTTRNMTGVVLAGPAVLDGEGLADGDNANVWSGVATDPCTSGGADTSVRVERRRVDSALGGEEFVEVRDRVDLAALAAAGVGANVSLEDRGPLRFVRHSAVSFAGDSRVWNVAPFETVNGNGAWPQCLGGDVSFCRSPSPCVVATGCDANNECVYGARKCAPPIANCSVTFCSDELQGCAERKVVFDVAGRVSIGLNPLCALDPEQLAKARCGNGIVEAGEVCDGELCCDASCKMLRPSGTVCRVAPSGPTCTLVTRCDGNNATCPAAAIAAAGTECRPANASLGCDVAEKCDGKSGFCPLDASLAFMATCTPTVALDTACQKDPRCTNAGRCNALYTCNCTAMPTLCDTGDACWRGECAGGVCRRVVASAGTTCNDENACTVNDKCSATGVCAGTTGVCDGNCSGHGRCCASLCQCEPGWQGVQCADVDDKVSVTVPPAPVAPGPVTEDRNPFAALFPEEWMMWVAIGGAACVLLLLILAVVCIAVACSRKSKRRQKEKTRSGGTRESSSLGSMQLYDYNTSREASSVHATSPPYPANPFSTLVLSEQQQQQNAALAANATLPPALAQSAPTSGVFATTNSGVFNTAGAPPAAMTQSAPAPYATQASVPSVFSGVATMRTPPTALMASVPASSVSERFDGTADDNFGDLPEVNLDRESQWDQSAQFY